MNHVSPQFVEKSNYLWYGPARCSSWASFGTIMISLSCYSWDIINAPIIRYVMAGGYIALSTMLGQMVGSCISGILENSYPRKNILIASLLLGSAASMLFGIIRYYPGLLMLRIVTGGCQGAIVPVLFSLIGDFYSVDERATHSAVVSSCLGGGMMLGQLFTGYTLGKCSLNATYSSCCM